MSEPKRCIAESRNDFELRNQVRAGSDEIQMGALQRIAAATEKMAESYDDLSNERDRLKTRQEWLHGQIRRLQSQRSALRGVITRMRRQREAGR